MKKSNNKGFMLLETMVVSAFIITTLTFLYVQFSNLKKSYDESFKYDTIPELFKTKEIDKFINNNYGYADIINDVKESEDKYVELYNNSCNLSYFSKYNSYCNRLMNDMNVKTILLVSTDLSKLIDKLKTNNKYSNGLYLYIKKINQSTNNNSYSLIVEFNDKKYANIIVQEEKITVTFDANGGTVSTESKEVKPGETYGTLPTPTKEGYTFKGWNGKNLININVNESTPSDTTKAYTTKRTFTPNTYVKGLAFDNYFDLSYVNSVSIENNSLNLIASSGFGVGFPLNFSYSNKYTLSYNATSDLTPISSVMFYKEDGTVINYIRTDGTDKKIITFNVPNETYNLVIEFTSNGTNINSTFTNIQLEEGDTATEYEPYYITSSTKVVQDKDHTLKAIWEQNS